MASWMSTPSFNEFIVEMERVYNNTNRTLIETSPGRYTISGEPSKFVKRNNLI